MLPVSRSRSRWRADLALAGVTLIWGATFVLVKEALRDSSTLLFLALRFAVAGVALALAFRPLPGRFTHARTLLGGGVLAGAFLFAGYLFQTLGLRYTTASKSAFLTGLSIVLVPLFGAVIARRLPGWSEGLGVLAALAGMGLMTLGGESVRMRWGDLLTVFCAVAFAVHILVVGHWAPKVSFAALSLVQIGTAAALATGSFWWAEPAYFRCTPRVAVALLVTGLLATALAFSVQAWAQQYTTPTHTALIFALEPVFAWITSFVVAHEVLSLRASAGALLILSGIVLVELRPGGGASDPVDHEINEQKPFGPKKV